MLCSVSCNMENRYEYTKIHMYLFLGNGKREIWNTKVLTCGGGGIMLQRPRVVGQ